MPLIPTDYVHDVPQRGPTWTTGDYTPSIQVSKIRKKTVADIYLGKKFRWKDKENNNKLF
jgi:hypothetical protein